MDHRSLVLAERPTGAIDDHTFRTVVADRASELRPGEVRVRTLWLAFDPAQRGALNDLPSYRDAVGVGDVMTGRGIGQIADSRADGFGEGDLVSGELGWQDWRIAEPTAIDLEHVPTEANPPTMALSVLGVTGLTAWVGMTKVAAVREGDSVLVTSAAGATGSVAGQIARRLGAARVVGTAGSEAKRAWVREVAGFDECLDHYDDKVFRAMRTAAGDDGFDVVFDNVGGTLLDCALANIAVGGRLALCGSISTGYTPSRPEVGLRNYQFLTTRRARAEGFIVLDHAADFGTARADLARWAAEGALQWDEDVLTGLDAAPQALQRLFDGDNLGKQLVQVADPAPTPPAAR